MTMELSYREFIMTDSQHKDKPLVVDLPADYRLRRVNVKVRTAIILIVLTMVMLSVSQEPIGWSFLSWISLVPWVVAVVGVAKYRVAGRINFLAGFMFFLLNLYWLIWVTTPGWIGLCFYLAWYFVLAGFIVRRVYMKYRWPFTLVLPVVWVSMEYLRATVMTGFPWLFLAHSQHEHIFLIQICDLFGTYGLTFLIAMTNGLVCDLLLRPIKQQQKTKKRVVLSMPTLILLTVCCVFGCILYGRYRVSQGHETMTEGPIVTVIQESIPQYVKESGQSNEEIFARHLALSKQAIAAEAKPDLIVWPETMVWAPLNKEFLNKYEYPLCQQFNEQLVELAKQGVAVLVGIPAWEINPVTNKIAKSFNSAILYLPGGKQFPLRYNKMHLVPFGEVVPFKQSWPWLHDLLNGFTPYDCEYSIDAGAGPITFEFTTSAGKKTSFAVAICYEDVMAWVPRKLLDADGFRVRPEFLLNISNDGWFVSGGKDKPVKPSSELIQHLVACKFRAVENRIGFARSVNTGISAFIKPDGSVQSGSLAGTLAEDPTERQAVAGFLTDKIQLDSRRTIYSKIHDTFAVICTILTALIFLAGFGKGKKEKIKD